LDPNPDPDSETGSTIFLITDEIRIQNHNPRKRVKRQVEGKNNK
jgi:hypothetical protein